MLRPNCMGICDNTLWHLPNTLLRDAARRCCNSSWARARSEPWQRRATARAVVSGAAVLLCSRSVAIRSARSRGGGLCGSRPFHRNPLRLQTLWCDTAVQQPQRYCLTLSGVIESLGEDARRLLGGMKAH